MSHDAADGTPHPIRSKPAGRPDGWFAACVCAHEQPDLFGGVA